MPRRLPLIPDEQLTPRALSERLRNRRQRVARARTIAVNRLSKSERVRLRLLYPEADSIERPSMRADCVDGPRPCPFVGCRWHLYLDVNRRNGSIKLNFPDLEVDELAHSCALDIADRGGATLGCVGALMNVSRERARQLENRALAKLLEHGLIDDLGKAFRA